MENSQKTFFLYIMLIIYFSLIVYYIYKLLLNIPDNNNLSLKQQFVKEKIKKIISFDLIVCFLILSV